MQYAGIMGGSELWSMALIALSGNDHELFQIMFPRNAKYSNRKNILHRVISRLLIALYYGEEESDREGPLFFWRSLLTAQIPPDRG